MVGADQAAGAQRCCRVGIAGLNRGRQGLQRRQFLGRQAGQIGFIGDVFFAACIAVGNDAEISNERDRLALLVQCPVTGIVAVAPARRAQHDVACILPVRWAVDKGVAILGLFRQEVLVVVVEIGVFRFGAFLPFGHGAPGIGVHEASPTGVDRVSVKFVLAQIGSILVGEEGHLPGDLRRIDALPLA